MTQLERRIYTLTSALLLAFILSFLWFSRGDPLEQRWATLGGPQEVVVSERVPVLVTSTPAEAAPGWPVELRAQYIPAYQHDRRIVLDLYYWPTITPVGGWGTRYGADRDAIEELFVIARESVAQYALAGYMLTGGGYGYHRLSDGEEYLLENRSSPGFGLMAQHFLVSQQSLNDQQTRLLQLGSMTYADFLYTVSSSYLGVVSLHSPNDIGRVLCLYNWQGERIGPVIVGDTAAQHDWTGLNTEARQDPLGYQTVDYAGREWGWIIGLPDSLYARAGGTGGPVMVVLDDGDCDA